MYTPITIVDTSVFKKLSPNFNTEQEQLRKIFFLGFEILNGFKVRGFNFIRKLKDNGVSLPEDLKVEEEITLSDTEASNVGLFGE